MVEGLGDAKEQIRVLQAESIQLNQALAAKNQALTEARRTIGELEGKYVGVDNALMQQREAAADASAANTALRSELSMLKRDTRRPSPSCASMKAIQNRFYLWIRRCVRFISIPSSGF